MDLSNTADKENRKLLALTISRLAPGYSTRATVGFGQIVSHRNSLYYPDPRYTCRKNPLPVCLGSVCKQYKNFRPNENLYNMPKKPVKNNTGNSNNYSFRNKQQVSTPAWAKDPNVRACFNKQPHCYLACSNCGCAYAQTSAGQLKCKTQSKPKCKSDTRRTESNHHSNNPEPQAAGNDKELGKDLMDGRLEVEETSHSKIQCQVKSKDPMATAGETNEDNKNCAKINLTPEETERQRWNCTKPNCPCNRDSYKTESNNSGFNSYINSTSDSGSSWVGDGKDQGSQTQTEFSDTMSGRNEGYVRPCLCRPYPPPEKKRQPNSENNNQLKINMSPNVKPGQIGNYYYGTQPYTLCLPCVQNVPTYPEVISQVNDRTKNRKNTTTKIPNNRSQNGVRSNYNARNESTKLSSQSQRNPGFRDKKRSNKGPTVKEQDSCGCICHFYAWEPQPQQGQQGRQGQKKLIGQRNSTRKPMLTREKRSSKPDSEANSMKCWR